eukprot:TRINITY_DN14268_c0_g1_i1.p2 TRINITY_DN14268_c0_g1~~TRINITY_DN14268_c0_g1_i1.p2  ORF type:complete len:135 (-),score=21.51 TRINITY_DN14268_c0_g1_i1:270-674(-)
MREQLVLVLLHLLLQLVVLLLGIEVLLLLVLVLLPGPLHRHNLCYLTGIRLPKVSQVFPRAGLEHLSRTLEVSIGIQGAVGCLGHRRTGENRFHIPALDGREGAARVQVAVAARVVDHRGELVRGAVEAVQMAD